MVPIRHGIPFLAVSLLVAACAAPAALPSLSPRAALGRHIQGIDLVGGGSFSVKADAPVGSFGPEVALPKGPALNLEFNRKGDDPGKINVVYYADNVPFTLTIRQGSVFAVIDADASDGSALVQVPGPVYDYYFATKGKPSGSLGIQDPVYFLAGSQASTTAKRDWVHLGLRHTKLPTTYRRGETRLVFSPKDLIGGFSGRLFPSANNPALPPVPPSIESLGLSDTVQPGASAAVSLAASDLNGDALTAHWSLNAGSIAGDANGATLIAPRTAGSYAVNLSLEDAYFVSAIPQPLMFAVPNLPPILTLSTLPVQVNPGEVVSFSASASDENWDSVEWRFTATGGAFSALGGRTQTGPQTTGLSNTWSAPAQAGSYTIEAIADDGHGAVVTLTRTIVVLDPTPSGSNHEDNGSGNDDKNFVNNGNNDKNDGSHDDNGHGNDPGNFDPSNPGNKNN